MISLRERRDVQNGSAAGEATSNMSPPYKKTEHRSWGYMQLQQHGDEKIYNNKTKRNKNHGNGVCEGVGERAGYFGKCAILLCFSSRKPDVICSTRVSDSESTAALLTHTHFHRTANTKPQTQQTLLPCFHIIHKGHTSLLPWRFIPGIALKGIRSVI